MKSLLSPLGNAPRAIPTSSAEDGRSTKPPRSLPRVRPDLLIGLREYGIPPMLEGHCGLFADAAFLPSIGESSSRKVCRSRFESPRYSGLTAL